MTCIVGVEHEGVVYMGADSITLNGWAKDIIAGTKLFKKAGMLFGCAGNPRMAQILRYQTDFAPRKQGQSDEEYLICEVIEKARLAFKECGYTETENGRELGANFLLGYNGHLYSVENGFQLCRSARKMCAMGAGEEFAMGALYATLRQFEGWTEVAITEALKHSMETAAELSAAVSQPFVVEKLILGEKTEDYEKFLKSISTLPGSSPYGIGFDTPREKFNE